MDLQKTLINFGLLGLFVFGIMSFIIITQNDGGVTTTITNNNLINQTYGDLELNLSSSKSGAQRASDNFGNITPTRGESFGELDVKSVISTTKTTRTIILGMFNILIKLPIILLGVSTIVSNIITSIIALGLVIGAWLVWKGNIQDG